MTIPDNKYIFVQVNNSVSMLGFDGKKEVVKGEKALEVISALSRAVAGKPSESELQVERKIREARNTYSVEWII